jgi:hypothetical protein
VVIDVDDLNLLPELKEFLPEIKETTRVRTRRAAVPAGLLKPYRREEKGG